MWDYGPRARKWKKNVFTISCLYYNLEDSCIRYRKVIIVKVIKNSVTSIYYYGIIITVLLKLMF